MYEVELKARIDNADRLRSSLAGIAGDPESAHYEDIYWNSAQDFVAQGKELRLRVIKRKHTETVELTYKDPPFDVTSQSKPEIQINVSNQHDALKLLMKLGFVRDITFRKVCLIYRFQWLALPVVLTVAEVPELAESFVEVETLVADKNATTPAFDKLYALLAHLHIPKSALTNTYYTDAVRAARNVSGA